LLPRLKKVIPSEALRSLSDFVSRRRAEAERADIVRWVSHAELATNRAGFVLSGELRAAARMIESENRVGQMTPREKVQDLVLYSYSEQHARLREALGIKIS
jgi:golgin subfamily B member 1